MTFNLFGVKPCSASTRVMCTVLKNVYKSSSALIVFLKQRSLPVPTCPANSHGQLIL